MKPIRFKSRLNRNVRSLIVVFVLVFCGILPAQSNTDSLFSVLRAKSLTEEQKLDLYYQIAKDYNQSNNDSAGYYAALGLELAESLNNYDYSVKNLIILGSVAIKQDSLMAAQDIYLKAAGLIDKINDNHAILSVWIMLGYINDLLDNYDKSIEYYFKGLYIADSLGMKKFISRFNNNIGTIYSNTGDYRKSLKYFLTAAGIFKESGEESLYANTLLNIGGDYYNIGMRDSAMLYLNKSKEINEQRSNHYGLVNFYSKMAEIEYDEGNYGKAIEYINDEIREIEFLEKSFFGSVAYNRTGTLLFLGDIYFKMNENEKAVKSYKEAKYLAEKSSFLKYVAGASEGLSKVFEKAGETDSAFTYFKLYKKYSDSVNSTENARKIAQLEMAYQLKNERKMMQLEKEKLEYRKRITRLINIIITSALITGLLIFVFLYIHQKDKHKQSLLKQQNLRLEKERLGKELELKNKELTTNVMYLLKKNELIADISGKLKSIECKTGSFKSTDIVDIVRELDRNTSDEIWREFEKRFKDVYGDFYERLTAKFPNLTPNELKLSAFLKLNMSTKEISSITYQTPETLKTARHRLRKKLGLTREDNLVAFLNQI